MFIESVIVFLKLLHRRFVLFKSCFAGERQDVVEILVGDTELRQTLVENYLKRMPDFQKIEWRFIKNKATLQVRIQTRGLESSL